MQKIQVFLSLVLLALVFSCEKTTDEKAAEFITTFETSNGQETATYNEVIDFYIKLARNHPEINIQTIGQTDSGYPLHLVTFNIDGDFNFQKIHDDKTVLLVNNGIHPGESDGIDATMLLFRDLATQKIAPQQNVVLVTIPVYNVGGMLNRNSHTRANQNGPKAYGFRGNAQNYDLNRDFIKVDTENAKTFTKIFHLVKPDVFIDNHVSNGADYQYTLTHLFTQHNKLGGEMGDYLHAALIPKLEQQLASAEWDITPYVNVFNRPPETGFSQFMDHPRYSTGFTTLYNTFGMMVETHMLKPYTKRVMGTYELMRQMLLITNEEHQKIKELRKKASLSFENLKTYHLNWQLDTTQTTTLQFKGFEVDTLTSEVTGLARLKYDKDRPFVKNVAYSNYYVPADTVQVPQGYIIKKGWQKVIDRLNLNEVEFFELEADTILTVESYRIRDYSTRTNPYEGHYPHYNTSVIKNNKKVQFRKGDIVVPTQQLALRYILETLEPQAPDSFFNWNFFDTILQQKEGFSPYVFEDIAYQLLMENQVLRDSFLAKKQNDEVFNANWYAQLDWVFKHSPHYEPAHLQYPIYRVTKGSSAASIFKD
ncbi:M14 family metallopeptidase [uncultured Croceitalea sp.]|uniref:M14 family metallopeptidase n=1 Tax=uncultured Croceitalea sp. TaxID=1798908 RepID=UPI0033063BD1